MPQVQKSSLRFIPRAQPAGGNGGESPWTRSGAGVIYPSIITDDVVIGDTVMVGGERLRIRGGLRIDDPAANLGYLELAEGDSVAVSPAGSFRLRWNQALTRAEISENGGAWLPLLGGAVLPTALVSATYSCPSGVSIGDAVYLSASNSVDQADADDLSKVPCIGVVVSKPSSTSCVVQYYGELTGYGGLTPGGTVYLSKTPGQITQTSPAAIGDLVQRIGFARNASTVVLQLTQETTILQ